MKKIILGLFIFLIGFGILLLSQESQNSNPYSYLQEDLTYRDAMKRWKHIVIHHSASPRGNAEIFHQAHLKRGWDGLGYHFVVGNGNGMKDGEIQVGFRWKEQKHGAHAGNEEYNQHGIGICLVGNFEETHITEKQLQALTYLLKTLTKRCNIPNNRIVGHRDVKNSTLCPGKNCSMEYIRKIVE